MSKFMLRLIGSFFIIAFVFIFSGCEYDFALAPKQGLPLDNMLIGVWENDKDNRIEISKKNQTEYNIRFATDGKNFTDFNAYPIKIGNRRLVQIIEEEKSDQPYDLASYSIKGNQLTINFVRYDGNQAELKKAIIANKPKVFGDSIKFTKTTRKNTTVVSNRNSNWVTSLKKDSITDESYSIASNVAQEKTSIFYVRCSNKDLSVFVEWNTLMEDLFDSSDYNTALKDIRWDSEIAYKMMWNLSRSRQTTYSFDRQSAGVLESILLPFSMLDFPRAYKNRNAEIFTDDKKFIELLLKHQKLVIRGTSYNYTSVDSTFDITNTAGSLKKDFSSCLSSYNITLQ